MDMDSVFYSYGLRKLTKRHWYKAFPLEWG